MTGPKIKYAKCDECTLKSNKFVPSEINDSKILVLAEAPGLDETKEGKPLVGRAGQDLAAMMAELGMKRQDVSFINSVGCRPTLESKNRTPTEREINCCNNRMAYEIGQLNPDIIIAMGKTPYIALGGKVFTGFRMADVVGTEFKYKNSRVIITYHPAAISHSGGFTSERGKMLCDEIKRAFIKALEAKQFNKQLELL